MLNLFRMRHNGRKLGREIRLALNADTNDVTSTKWKGEYYSCNCCNVDGSDIKCGEYAVSLRIRRLRVFDAVHLYYAGQEVWLPLITRILLRAAARNWIAVMALNRVDIADLPQAKMEKAPVDTRTCAE